MIISKNMEVNSLQINIILIKIAKQKPTFPQCKLAANDNCKIDNFAPDKIAGNNRTVV